MKDRIVRTEAGEIRGIFGYDPRITVFKGVPYAAPPVGELRWRAPQPPVKWEGIREAFEYGPMSIQDTPGLDPEDFWSRELHPAGTEFEMSEDCLYLNIFTPAKNGNEKYPVLVYIHGGGYRGGYPYEIEFDWEHMARKGIVCVGIQYRLGVLGFLAHPWLSAEYPEEPKGNYGLQDQLAAIQWVKRNIEAFGGDPERITIAGQSAGAGSVQSLLASPMARGTFSGAIIQSGITIPFKDTIDPLTAHTLERAEKTGADFFEKAGIKSLEQARNIPALELNEIDHRCMESGIHFQPTVDHIFLKESAFEAMYHNNWAQVPVIAGYNAGEVKMFNRFAGKLPETLEQLETYAERYGMRKEEFLACAGCQKDADVVNLFDSAAFTSLIVSARTAAYVRAGQGNTTYLYEFNCDIPGEDDPGAFHGAELWFAYDSMGRSWRPFTGKHYDMSRQISSYWVNFVKTGNPNGKTNFGEELPVWEPFGREKTMQMCFTERSEEQEVCVEKMMKFRLSHTVEEE